MSFYTSLTGLNAATAMLGVTSNNISNVGTTGFKRSRADFGDIFATSPLQKASSTVGQGVSLKQVSQEFSQGNISFSSNALDLAVTGDGFFPMRSADGLQELFTRNGSFLLNEQFNVVNSSGQRLMAATVDSTGSANVNERVVLTIPQKTSGDAKQTSEVSLGLNFPADAEVITEPFNRSNPATYNKSTAFTVYDNGGNGYLATIYYTKTSNANQNVPFNKWQTNVFVGEDQVAASLVQATDANNERIYVNQYGQTKPYSEVKDELTTAKTQLFSLDELTNKKISIAATATGNIVPETGANSYDWVAGLPNGDAKLAGLLTDNAFTVDVDNSGSPVTVSLAKLAALPAGTRITGDLIAQEATNQLISKFGTSRGTTTTSTTATATTATTASSVTSTVGSITTTVVTTEGTLASPGTITTTVTKPASNERYGMKVGFDAVNKQFFLESGTTGDTSSVALSGVSTAAATAMGLKPQIVSPEAVATRGIPSKPAVTFGITPTVNTATNFSVDATNNKFIVTVDGIKSTVTLPVREYSLAEFTQALENEINNMKEVRTDGLTPKEISGVKVEFDITKRAFKFTSGTSGADSFIKISGEPIWGLSTVEAGRGETSTWILPTQRVDVVNGTPQPKYIDAQGNETTSTDGYVGLPAWSPVYLDKGELTFDTGGNLVSPIEGTQLETVYLAGGKGALRINIDYSASTQFSSAFAVLSQSQDGAPEGDLVGVTIGNDGLVSASFSNGSQKSLAKILLANFSSPVGLRQIGDSSFLASAASGRPILGTPGSAGFGTLRAGATERANVDLTQELVDLITAQRNFQANAKAIETSSTMTSAIINLRS
ncbi:MAG: Flagellar hook protein FlgE [Pseudomonadota bacterium]